MGCVGEAERIRAEESQLWSEFMKRYCNDGGVVDSQAKFSHVHSHRAQIQRTETHQAFKTVSCQSHPGYIFG